MFPPQQYAVPLATRPQVCLPPLASPMNVCPPATAWASGVGSSRPTLVELPSCPKAILAPAVRRTGRGQSTGMPAARDEAGEGERAARACGGVGASLPLFTVVPSCPRMLLPQHQATPSVATPHVWVEPAARLVKARAASIGAGVGLGSPGSFPAVLPSWPLKLLPQQYATPAAVSPQVWDPPPARLVNVRSPSTASGERFSKGGGAGVVVPS